MKLVQPQQKVTLIHSRDKLLSSEPLPDEFKEKALEVLRESGVEVLLSKRVLSTDPVATSHGTPLFKLHLGDGSELKASLVIRAISQSLPTTSYLPKTALNEDGCVKVTSMQVIRTSQTYPLPLTHFQDEHQSRHPKRSTALCSRRYCSLDRY